MTFLQSVHIPRIVNRDDFSNDNIGTYMELLYKESQQLNIPLQKYKKSIRLLGKFLQYYKGDLTKLEPKINYDDEDANSIIMMIARSSVVISLEFENTCEEDFTEAYMSYEQDGKCFLTNSTAQYIANKLNELMNGSN